MREQCFISRPPPPTPPRSHPATQASRGPRLEEGSARSRTISSKRVLDQRLHRSCHSGAPPISALPEIGSVSAKSRLTPTFGAKRRRARNPVNHRRRLLDSGLSASFVGLAPE